MKLREVVEKQTLELAAFAFSLFDFLGTCGVLHVRFRLSTVFISNSSVNSAPGPFCLFCDGNNSFGV